MCNPLVNLLFISWGIKFMYNIDSVKSYHVSCLISTPSVSGFSIPLQNTMPMDMRYDSLSMGSKNLSLTRGTVYQ